MARYWRLLFKSVNGGPTAPWISITELELFDANGLNLALSKPTAVSNLYPSGFGPAIAVDGIKTPNADSATTYWSSGVQNLINGEWFRVDLGSPVDIVSVAITCMFGENRQIRTPKNFIVQKSASTDGPWEDVWEVNDNIAGWGPHETRKFMKTGYKSPTFTRVKRQSVPTAINTSSSKIEVGVELFDNKRQRVNRGNGYISGKISGKTTPTLLTLYDPVNSHIVQTLEANIINEYRFNGIRTDILYDVIATDVEGIWESKVTSRVEPKFAHSADPVDLDLDISDGSFLAMDNIEPIYSQSSIWQNFPSVTYEVLNDGDSTTGAGTDDDGTTLQWIKADLGSPMFIRKIVLGIGHIGGWGSVEEYIDGAVIQSSNDDVIWDHVFNVGSFETEIQEFIVPNGGRTARYWRLAKDDYIATSEFQFIG